MKDVVDTWNLLGYGFQYDNGPLVNHLVWADNVYLVASSILELQVMAQMLTQRLHLHKLRWKVQEMVYIAGTNILEPTDFSFKDGHGQTLFVKAVDELE
eukprot:887447-Karenia_brevis.AAC.1